MHPFSGFNLHSHSLFQKLDSLETRFWRFEKSRHPLHIPFFKKIWIPFKVRVKHFYKLWTLTWSGSLIRERKYENNHQLAQWYESPAGFTQQRRNTGRLFWRRLLTTHDLTLFFLVTKPERVNTRKSVNFPLPSSTMVAT